MCAGSGRHLRLLSRQWGSSMHPELWRSFSRHAEDKLLAIIEPFAQLKVFERRTSWDGTRRLPICITAVHHDLQIIGKRPDVFGPILLCVAAGVSPGPGRR